MKRIFIAIAVIALTTTAKAQTTFSAGLEVGLPSGDASSISGLGLGGSAKAKFALGKSENSALTGSVGFISFAGKDVTVFGITVKSPSVTAIPVKVGYRYTAEGGVYFEPQIGLTFFSGGGSGSGFTYAANVGYNLSESLDLSARYESAAVTGGSFNHIGLRLAYAFGGK
jgi:hypothetical protein